MRRQIRNGYSCISYSRVLNGMKTILNSRYGKSIEPPLLGSSKALGLTRLLGLHQGRVRSQQDQLAKKYHPPEQNRLPIFNPSPETHSCAQCQVSPKWPHYAAASLGFRSLLPALDLHKGMITWYTGSPTFLKIMAMGSCLLKYYWYQCI